MTESPEVRVDPITVAYAMKVRAAVMDAGALYDKAGMAYVQEIRLELEGEPVGRLVTNEDATDFDLYLNPLD